MDNEFEPNNTQENPPQENINTQEVSSEYNPNGKAQNNYTQQQNNYIPPQNNYAQQQNNYIPPQNNYAQQQNNYIPPQNNNTPPMYAQPPEKRRLSKGWIIGISVVIAAMLIAIVFLSISIVKKTADYQANDNNLFDNFTTESAEASPKDKDKIVISLPVSAKPDISSNYYENEETGLLTTEGVAQKVLPSQVLIGIYNDTPYFNTSVGSGVILTSDGYILTNAHVIDGALDFKVTLNDDRQFEAKIVGIDRTSDLAVIKIDAQDLIAAELGDSSSAALGEGVAVIGAAGNLENSITYGYISALNREIETDYTSSGKLNCIQTDAALNPGNSGGALVNMYGQVIGISVAGMDAEFYDGIGFAIQINDVIPIAEDLMKNGYVPGRARIGILYIPMTTELASQYEVPIGLCVVDIQSDCDIASKDVQQYDIITAIDGVNVYDDATITKAMENKYAGQTITLTIYRKTITDEIIEFDVEIILSQKYDTVDVSAE